MKFPGCCFCGLIVTTFLITVPAEEVYFFPQTNLFGEVNHDWFNGDNWFVYDELGSFMAAGTPPRDGQTAIISGLADVGTSLVRVNGLVLTNGATITNGTFGLSDVVMCANSAFQNSKVNLMGTMIVEGPGCALVRGTFKVLSGAVAVIEPRRGAESATLLLQAAATLQVDGRVRMSKQAILEGSSLPQSKVEISTLGVITSSGTNTVRGSGPNALAIDHNGLVEAGPGRIQFQEGLQWNSTTGVNRFRTLDTSSWMDFTGNFQVRSNVISEFAGPGTNRFLGGALVDGSLRIGAELPGNLEIHADVSGGGSLQVIPGADTASLVQWHDGLISCKKVEVQEGAVMSILEGSVGAHEIADCTFVNMGVCVLSAPGLRLSSNCVITNVGEFEIVGNSALQAANGTVEDGQFNNVGVLRKIGSGTASFGQGDGGEVSTLFFNNSGVVEVSEGVLKLGPGTSAGEFRTAESASLWFWTGTHVFQPQVRFTGSGWVKVHDAVQKPIWRMLGTAHVENLELGRNGLVEGASSELIVIKNLVVRDLGAVNKAALSVQGAQLIEGSRFEDAAFQIIRTLSITGVSHEVKSSSLVLEHGSAGTLEPGGTLLLDSGAELHCLGDLVLSAGASIHGSGNSFGRVQIHSGGVLRSQGPALLTGIGESRLILDNSGLLQVEEGALSIANNVRLQTTAGPGTFASQPAGRFLFSEQLIIEPGVNVVFLGPGTNSLPEASIDGTLHVGGIHPKTGSFSPGFIELVNDVTGGGVLLVRATNGVGGLLDWRGGNLSLSNLTVFAGATACIRPPTALLSNGIFENRGLARLLATNFHLSRGAVFRNEVSGLVEATTNSIISAVDLASAGVITNAGVFRKLGPGTIQFGSSSSAAPAFNNSGSLEVLEGDVFLAAGRNCGEFRTTSGSALNFWEGSYELAAGARFTGNGAVRVEGAYRASSLVVNAPVTVPHIELGEKGIIGGVKPLTVGATMLWTGGRLEGESGLNIAESAVLSIDGRTEKRWSKQIINNSGTVIWKGGVEVISGEAAQLNNGPTGSVDIQGDARLLFSGTGPRATILNSGTLRKNGTSTVTKLGADLNTSGRMEVNAGTLQIDGNWTVSGGEMVIGAGSTVVGQSIELAGGSVSGEGTVRAQVSNNNAIVSPGTALGTLSLVEGHSYTQSNMGKLLLEIGGKQPSLQHDQLVVDGEATLEGALELRLVGGFSPVVGDVFKVLLASGVNGSFTEVFGVTPIKGTIWVPRYSGTDVTVALGRSVVIEKLRTSKGQVQFGFQSVDGFTYIVQATETLAPLQWQTISTCIGDGSWKSVGEPIRSDQRFFRIVVQ